MKFCSCYYEYYCVSVRQGVYCWNSKDIAGEEISILPHGLMVKLGGELGK
jgi:hypothetical protein